MKRFARIGLGVFAGMFLLCAAVPARADNDDTLPLERMVVDTTYGRIEGDITLVGGIGATFGPTNARGTLDARLRYLDSAGVFVSYEDAIVFGGSSSPSRLLAGGVELRPMFLARWSQGLYIGNAPIDLLIDSFGLELGLFLDQKNGEAFASRAGLQAGVGLEFPLFLKAEGLWLGFHGGARWSEDSFLRGQMTGPIDRALYGTVTVSWHQLFHTHLVDLRDRAPR